MQGRIAAMMACGFASFVMIGTAGAVSDSYFENIIEERTLLVSCDEDPMEQEDAVEALPNCSVHRVSTTFARQIMATDLKRDRAWDD